MTDMQQRIIDWFSDFSESRGYKIYFENVDIDLKDGVITVKGNNGQS